MFKKNFFQNLINCFKNGCFFPKSHFSIKRQISYFYYKNKLIIADRDKVFAEILKAHLNSNEERQMTYVNKSNKRQMKFVKIHQT